MDVFVARQPIFDRSDRVTAYELLFRAGLENAFPAGTDSDHASAQLIANTLSVIGFRVLVGTKQAYVNASRQVLVEQRYVRLPPEQTVIEVLETVEPDGAVIQACRNIRQAGYLLALDDFVWTPAIEPLVALANIIKVDFRATSLEQRRELVRRLDGWKGELLAEKVETREEQRQAKDEGYAYFQGYFYARPEIIARRDVPASKLVHLQFMAELLRPDFDPERLEDVIRRDRALATRLLRYLNSAHFALPNAVTSLRQAIVLLGEQPFRQWASLVTVLAIGSDKGEEVPLTSLVRGRFCELVAKPAGLSEAPLEAFLAGLLSTLDILVGRPMAELVAELPLAASIRAALLGQEGGKLGSLIALVRAHERASWSEVAVQSAALALPDALVTESYREAVAWAESSLPVA